MEIPAEVPSRIAAAHRRFHARPSPVADCWHCQRGYARCLSKVTYTDRESALVVAVEINDRNDWTEPLMAYPCGWSGDLLHWHLRHCLKAREFKKARRLRRIQQRDAAMLGMPG